MIDKLLGIKKRFEEVEILLSDPEMMQDMKKFTSLSKEYKDLEKIVVVADEYENVLSNIKANKGIIANDKDPEFREMAKMELGELTTKRDKMEEDIKFLLVPKDPADDKNVIFEIRAGTGGDEASIFAGDLYKLYTRYCEKKGWKVETVDVSHGTSGGYKEVIFNVSGENCYGILKFESGVHRVQRVPETETQGRVHTSAATVAVLPEAEEIDVDLKDSDIRKDTFCSSGPGGQSVNTTYSAVRLVHLPTGITVQCQDEKSQIKNLAKAMKVLRSRIYEIELQKHLDAISSQRKTMVSSGDRSAKIRTYNYPQGRVTDHRIGMTLYNLPAVMGGEIDEIIDSLRLAENTEKLKEGAE
ncbi:MAG: peptide chain release factor 1 [Sphingobacteriales bacterium]|jgi:peptide chain release factor 1